MKVIDLINELQRIVENGNTLPFSAKALINPEEALEIMDEIREALPKELTQAQEIVQNRNQILMEAQDDADNIRREAEQRVNELVNNNEIMKNANKQAEAIVENAQNSARDIRVGTQHYADKILYELQVQLKSLYDEIEADRVELKDM